jgi:hypothetical protein
MTAIKLNELQRQIITAIKDEQKVISARCGWGSGKTCALVFSILFIAKTRPGTSTLVVTDTTPRYNSVLMPEMQKWLSPLGWTYNHTNKQWLDPSTGSTVWCRSYYRPGTRDATHNPLEGLNITSGVCLIDECQTLDMEVAHKALGRLRAGPSPILILVGLPVADAWWCSMAENAGYIPMLFTSYVNQDNLADEWFEATKLLPAEEREAMIMNKPKPPTGLIYQEFTEGHIIEDWTYKPTMTGRIAIDWGFRKPSVLIICHDEDLEADIICHEFNPKEVTTEQLTALILSVAWPRSLKDQAPSDRIWLDTGVADKAGKARNDQTGKSAFRVMRQPPPLGLGLPLRSTTDPIKVDILNGVQRLKRAFNSRRYLITKEVWERGERVTGNSIRKALLSYAWDNKEQPKKDGREDPLDALRYDCIIFNWNDVAVDQGYKPRGGGIKTREKRRVNVGGSKVRSF